MRPNHNPLIIIGNGMIGHRLCRRLVDLGVPHADRVVVFTEEPRPAYDRTRLSACFAGADPHALSLAPTAWYAENRIDLHLDDPVVAVDRERRTVLSAAGIEIPYHRLVFATGALPFLPPIAGRDLTGVFAYRTIDDIEAIRAYCCGETPRDAKRVAVIGGGLMGLEAAAGLAALGIEVHVVEHAAGLMLRQLDLLGAELLRQQVERLGLRIHLGRGIRRIARLGNKRMLLSDDGQQLLVDAVVIAAGARPRDELATTCGLRRGLRGGIVVNNRLQTSDPHIFAVGECTTYQDVVYGPDNSGFAMAEVLATNFAGGHARFTPTSAHTCLQVPGVAVAAMGEYRGNEIDSVLTAQLPGIYRRLVVRHGRLVGATAVGPWSELERVRRAVADGSRLWPWQVARFRRSGNLWPSWPAWRGPWSLAKRWLGRTGKDLHESSRLLLTPPPRSVGGRSRH